MTTSSKYRRPFGVTLTKKHHQEDCFSVLKHCLHMQNMLFACASCLFLPNSSWPVLPQKKTWKQTTKKRKRRVGWKRDKKKRSTSTFSKMLTKRCCTGYPTSSRLGRKQAWSFPLSPKVSLVKYWCPLQISHHIFQLVSTHTDFSVTSLTEN